jgi:hypothetical protein
MHSGVTPTMVLRYLNRNLGTLVQKLELSADEMMRIVFQESLPTYSKFFPYLFRTTVGSDQSIDGSNSYTLRTEDLEIIGVQKAFPHSQQMYGIPLMAIVGDPVANQLMQDNLSKVLTPYTWKFESPYTLRLYPKIVNNQSVLVFAKAVHPKHMKTIPMSMRDEFLQLCLLDVLISLYPIRHRFTTMNTAYGSIEPFMDLVDDAQSRKEELIQRWRDNYLARDLAKKVFIA